MKGLIRILAVIVLLTGCAREQPPANADDRYLRDVYCGDSHVAAAADTERAVEYGRTHNVECAP